MIAFRKIDYGTLGDVLKLSVADDQRAFVADNAMSVMEAYIALSRNEVALPFGVYDGEQAVGFIMIGYGRAEYDDEPMVATETAYTIWRLMIDRRYQKRGYGRQAMAEALRFIKTGPCGPGTVCWLSYEPENSAAKSLYHAFGFVENGEMCGGEVVAVLPLGEQA